MAAAKRKAGGAAVKVKASPKKAGGEAGAARQANASRVIIDGNHFIEPYSISSSGT